MAYKAQVSEMALIVNSSLAQKGAKLQGAVVLL